MWWSGLAIALLSRWDLTLLALLFLWWVIPWPGRAAVDERDWGAQGTEVKQPESQGDVTDGKVANSAFYQSLKKVFDCSYSQFILLWYNPPEAMADQPLYSILLDEFNASVDLAVKRIRNLNFTRIELGLIQILTNHLQSAKKENNREKIFQTREEEVNFLRRTAEALIHNLLPDSVWKVKCHQLVMQEVVALKVLEETINMVCEADFINQSLIKLLDQDSLAPEEKNIVLNVPEENIKINREYSVTQGDKEKKLKGRSGYQAHHKVKKLFNKVYKKCKKKRDKTAGSSTQDMDEVDGPCLHNETFRTLSTFSEDDSIEDDNFNPSHEMFDWLKENCVISTEEKPSLRNSKITVSEISWEEPNSPCCTIDVENLKDAEGCWYVQRKFHEFQDLQNELSKVVAAQVPISRTFCTFVDAQLPSVNGLPSDMPNNEFREDFKHQLNVFLKMLISDESVMRSEIVLNFFSPDDRDYWGLLTPLFAEGNEETDVENETLKSPYENNLDEGKEAFEPPKTNPGMLEMHLAESAESLPSTMTCDGEDFDHSFRSMTDNDVQKASGGHKRRKTVSGRCTELPEGIAHQIHKLLGEIMCLERNNFKITVVLQLVKYILVFRKKSLKKYLDQFFSKEWVTWYIDHLREVLWPNGNPACPSPPRSEEEKASTKEKAEELLLSKVSAFFRFLHGKKIISHLFSLFQDVEANKRLVYGKKRNSVVT
ncbi:uncharacterized protein [Narcine bancroftii]|uniref:uncharacterized protein isoform X2 n=1 Tax=Narcine bancroftii TaxID=1343680 RepID=UPI003831C891